MIVFRRSAKYTQIPVPRANGNTSQEAFLSLIEAFRWCHRHCHSLQSRVLTCSFFRFLSSPEATLWRSNRRRRFGRTSAACGMFTSSNYPGRGICVVVWAWLTVAAADVSSFVPWHCLALRVSKSRCYYVIFWASCKDSVNNSRCAQDGGLQKQMAPSCMQQRALTNQ